MVLAVLVLFLFCSVAAVAADCPSGCGCLLPADAKAKGYDACGGQLSVCGYDRYQNTLYCYKTGLSLVTRTLAPLSLVTTTPPAPTCAAGCTCMLEADAKAKFGTYSRCSETPCYSIMTGSQQLNAYCFRQGTPATTSVPTCPQGCSCISDATAKARGGTWSRCTAEVCGYEQSTATLAAVVNVPKYCMKQDTTTTPVCPEGCACISDGDAKLKGLSDRCDNTAGPCGYRLEGTGATTAAVRVPLYCYKTTVTTVTPAAVCPEGCGCMNEAEAKAKFGSEKYTRCSEKICGYDQSAATANGVPRYCFRPLDGTTPAPVCPQGCDCTTNATAVGKGLTVCGGKLVSCGFNENKEPLYCYAGGQGSAPVCPQGCACTTDEAAKEKGLTSCRGTRTSCGYNENKQPLFCFEQVPSPTCVYDYQKNACAGTCPQGSSCGLLASEKDATGKVIYGVCGCTVPPATACAFDVQKNACTGACQSGAACTVVGKKVDEKTGESLPVCGCPQPASCSYDYGKDACVGTCTTSGDACALNTIYRDPTSGKVTYAECHCKGGGDATSSCTCDPVSGSCTGTCAAGKFCTMTGTATDNAGKNSCTACACRDTCVLDANNRCSGTCPQGGQCTSITVKDDSGQEKVSCGCGGAAEGTPAGTAARQPGFFDAIASFFNRLFGGK